MNRTTTRSAPAGWDQQLPEPGRFWIRYFPRTWPGPQGLWQHLALGRLGPSGGSPIFNSDLEFEDFDDLVYLPPVREEFRRQRDELAGTLLKAGSSVLLQVLAGEPRPALPAIYVIDPLELLVTGALEALSEVPTESIVAWPLIVGVTDHAESWKDALGRLSRSGVRCVQATEYDLEPIEKRRLAELGNDTAFDALFHGDRPSERSFARVAASLELAPFLARPANGKSGFVARNRSIAAHISLVGELWSRNQHSESGAQRYFAAARWVDQTRFDVSALCREGNLGVASQLDTDARELVDQFVTSGRSDLCDELMRDYTSETGTQ